MAILFTFFKRACVKTGSSCSFVGQVKVGEVWPSVFILTLALVVWIMHNRHNSMYMAISLWHLVQIIQMWNLTPAPTLLKRGCYSSITMCQYWDNSLIY